MTTPNRKGRRQPNLVPTADVPETQALAEQDEPEEPEGEALPFDDHEHVSLLAPGAKVEASVTLAVDFGDGKTNFIKYGTEDFVLNDETHDDARARITMATLDGVITLVDDTRDLLEQYGQELERRKRAISAQTSGQ